MMADPWSCNTNATILRECFRTAHLAKAVMRVSHKLGSSFVDPSSFWKEALPNTECTCTCTLMRVRAKTSKACANQASMHNNADRPHVGVKKRTSYNWLQHVWLLVTPPRGLPTSTMPLA